MKIKRTVAEDMRAAMQIIRDTHGPDAVILSKRTVAGGIEVVSAIDVDAEDTVAPDQRSTRRAKSDPPRARRGTVAELEHEISAATTAEQAGANRTVARAAQLLESAKAARRALTPSASTQAAAAKAEIDATQTPTFEQRLAQANADLKAQPKASQTPADKASAVDTATTDVELPSRATPEPALHQPEQRPSVVTTAAPVISAATVEMQAELKLVRQLMSQQLAIMGWQAHVERSPASVALLRDLYALGFEAGLSQRVCDAVSLQADPDTNWQLARHWLAARLPIAEGNPLSDAGVSAVFGSSGSGKTSTVVKMAARFALAEGPESVVLISTDSERVGGTATLNAFANVLGVPVHCVNQFDELEHVIEDLRQRYARVLIDTGNGASNRSLALELADIADRCEIPMQNYLTLSATSTPGDSLALLGALGRRLPVATIVTKIDEAHSLGGVYSTLIDNQLPVAAVSRGPRVPDDIETVDTETLIAWCEQAPAAREAASSLSEAQLVARFGVAS